MLGKVKKRFIYNRRVGLSPTSGGRTGQAMARERNTELIIKNYLTLKNDKKSWVLVTA